MTVAVATAIKAAIGDDGERVDVVKRAAADDHDADRVDTVFDRMQKRGDVYVVPDDPVDVVKVTP